MIRFRFAEALWLFEHPSKEARVAGQGAKRSTVLEISVQASLGL